MTGYGNAVANFKEKRIHVEIKALNSKALDLNVRIAPIYREKEMEIRQMVAQRLVRGKVDVSIWIEKNVQDLASPINQQVVADYYRQIKQMSENMGIDTTGIKATDWLTVIMRLPDTMTTTEVEELSEEEWMVLRDNVALALQEVVDFRKQEGEALQAKFKEKVDNIEQLLQGIEPFEKARVDKIRLRIVESLEKLTLSDYDGNRLEQEMIYYIEKLDISEEKQRLKNHLDYFRQTMADEPGQGKKLGFIAQEMGREINTTGSKSNLAEMQNIVVKMKDELEQIKEQVLNAL